MPAERVVEAGNHAFVVFDAYPVSPGHSLVVSRRRRRIDRDLQPSGYNIGVNVGHDAGQAVMHVHVHVIPRYRGDTPEPTGGVRGVIPGKARYL
jgi:diadenosine tetraphosphate (Ap4A) HIT family hydrolase